MPGKGSSCHGFQLWINLPIELKDIEPSYQKAEAERIQKKEEDKATIRTSIGDNSPITVNQDIIPRHSVERKRFYRD